MPVIASLTGEAIRSTFGEDVGQRYLDQIRQGKVIVEQAKERPEELLAQAKQLLSEAILMEMGTPSYFRGVGKAMEHVRRGLTGKPIYHGLRPAFEDELFEMLEEGLSVDDAMTIWRIGRDRGVPQWFDAGSQAARSIAADQRMERLQGGPAAQPGGGITINVNGPVNRGGVMNYNADRQSQAGRPYDSRLPY